MRTVILLFAMALGAVTPASGQLVPPPPKVELRPYVGALIPTGPHREHFATAPLYGIQTAVEMSRSMHILGSLAWSPGRSKFDVAEAGVDIVQFDVGAEYNLRVPLGGRWEIKPFLGFGGGARSYRYHSEEIEGNMPLTLHAALGTELQHRHMALRLESRRYMFQCTDPLEDRYEESAEVAVALGLAYHFPRER